MYVVEPLCPDIWRSNGGGTGGGGEGKGGGGRWVGGGSVNVNLPHEYSEAWGQLCLVFNLGQHGV